MDNELLEQRRQLESGFASENWSHLNYQQRLELCRELENNFAAEHNVSPCYVTAKYMDGATYGYQTNHSIVLNRHVLEGGAFHVILRNENKQPILDANGDPMERVVQIPAANWATMETVYHEGTHGIQEAKGKLAFTYIDSNDDYALYRLQRCEKEAFFTGRSRTLNAIRIYETTHKSQDPTAERYRSFVENDSFQKYLNEAVNRYHDPLVEQTLNQFISDRDNGTTPAHPSQSYQAIAKVYDKHHELNQNASNSLPLDNNSKAGTAVGTGNMSLENDTYSGIESSSVDSHDPNDLIDDGYGVDYTTESNNQKNSFGINDGYGVEDSIVNIDQDSGLRTNDGFGTDDSIKLSNHNIDTNSCPVSCSNEGSTSNGIDIG